jgi:biopolymer transport protein ExbD
MRNHKIKNSGPRLNYSCEINITSLADVAICLMIIFLIAGVSVAMSRAGITVAVPHSSVAAPQSAEGAAVTVDKQGKLYIEDKLVATNEFVNELMLALSRKVTSRVYLVADQGVDYGIIINVLSKIREAGIENVNLVANPQVIQKLKTKKAK